MVAPKAFISHASEDKDRFVMGFATKLRQRGVDAWLDRWEMLPGDSLVDKIFEEGIKDAAAFIVVLSATSIQKKWVREEMNAAFVARVSRQCRIIPVVIDDCEVPEALKSTLWESIRDLQNYEESLRRIVASIVGRTEKPPVGAPPAYVSTGARSFAPELEHTDAAVLWRLCEAALSQGHDGITDLTVLDELISGGAAESDVLDALEVLNEKRLIRATKILGSAYRGSSFCHLRVSLSGFDLYARHRFPEFDDIVRRIASKIVNEDISDGQTLIDSTSYPAMLVEHICDLFENNGLVAVDKYFGGFRIRNVSPSLKRMIR